MFDPTYIGQERAKQMLKLPIATYYKNGKILPNILLDWPPGYGKTQFGKALAKTINVPFYRLDMTSLGKPDLGRALFRFNDESPNGYVLLFDEIHASRRYIQDSLLILLEERKFQFDGSAGYSAHFPNVVFVLATTDGWKVPPALVSRCQGGTLPYTDYSDDDVKRMCKAFLGTQSKAVPTETLNQLIPATSHEPRTARAICDRMSMYIDAEMPITPEDIRTDLDLTIDGLKDIHCRYLVTIRPMYHDAPSSAPASTLSKALKIHLHALPRVESLLERKGYLTIGDKYVRQLTETGMQRADELRGRANS